jgi:hypothetical protein
MTAIKTKLASVNTPKLYATDGDGELMDKTAFVRIFGPGRFTYYVAEWDGEDTVFGFCLSPLGSDCDEWGYASISEWEDITASNPLRSFEAETSFKPCPVGEALAKDAKMGLADCKRYAA